MELIDDQWKIVEPLIPKKKPRKDRKGRPISDARLVLEGILWILGFRGSVEGFAENVPILPNLPQMVPGLGSIGFASKDTEKASRGSVGPGST